MRKIIYLLGLMMPLISLNAQVKIQGKVSDQLSNSVEGATVSLLKKQDSSVVKFAITDKSGKYELDNISSRDLILTVSAIGFGTGYHHLNNTDSSGGTITIPEFRLQPEGGELGAVTVVGRKQMVEVRADRTILNVDAAVSNVGATALEVLEKSPGVSVDRDGNISLKGRQGVLVMIDDKPTYLSSADLAAMLGNMSASQLDQVEIMTNPPAKYDAAGNSGVINIKTKKNRQKGFNGNLSLSYGQGQYWRTNNSLNLNYRKNKVNLYLNYSNNYGTGFGDLHILRTYYDADGKTVTSIFEQPTNMHHSRKNNSLKIGMDYYLNQKTTLGIVASGFNSPRRFTSSSSGLLKDAAGNLDSTAYTLSDNEDHWKNGLVNINLRSKLNSNHEISADVDYVKYSSVGDQNFDNHIYYPDGTTVSRDKLRGRLPSDISIYSAKADYTRNFKSGMKLEAGLKSSLVKTDNTADYFYQAGSDWVPDYEKTNHFLYEENINAVYGNLSHKWKKWNFQAGLRYENTNYKGHQLGNPVKNDSAFSRKYNSLFPTVYISYELDSNNTFTINTGRRIDRPAYRQLNPFLFFINKFTYAAGNPFLQPQYTRSFEISHSYKGKLNTSLNYNRTTHSFNQIFRPEGEVTILTDGNVGTVDNYGFAINTQLSPASFWKFTAHLNINYKVVNGMAYGQEIKTDAFNGQVNFNNQFNFKKGWGAELSGFYNSRSIDGQFNIAPFGQLSTGFSKQVLKGKGSIRVNVRDLLYSQKIDGHILYGNVDEHFVQQHDSRSFNISFNYRFGKPMKDAAPSRNQGGSGDEQRRVGAGG